MSSLRVQGGRAFALMSAGQLASTIGSGLTSFALGVWVYQSTGSVTRFAMIQLAFWLPVILGSPVAGTLVDRWDRRRVMLLCDCGAAACTASLLLLLCVGRLALWQIYLTTFVSAFLGIFQRLARTAATPLLVPAAQLGRANGAAQAIDAAGQLVSPLLAGALVGWIGLVGVIWIDLGTFLLAILTLALIDITRPAAAAERAAKGSLLRDMVYGWRYIHARPGLLGLILYFTAGNFLVSFVMVLLTPLVLSFASPAVLGAVSSVGGFGMLAGSVVMGAWGGPRRRIWGLYAFAALAAVAIMLLGLRPSALLIGGAAFVGFFCSPIINSLANAILQSKVAPEVQGRVFGVLGMMTSAMTPLALLTSGPLADRVFEPLLALDGPLAASVGRVIGVGPGRGIGLFIVVVGLSYLLPVAAIYLHPRVRRIEEELPDAVLVQAAA